MIRSALIALFLGATSCVSTNAGNETPGPSSPADASKPEDAALPTDATPHADTWSTITVAPGLTVDMPGVPIEAEAGVLVLKRNGEGNNLAVQCQELAGPQAKRERFIRGARVGVIGDKRVIAETPVMLGGHKGLRLDLESETSAGRTRAHIVLVAGSMHVCNFMAFETAPSPELVGTERFLSSAKLP